jgi:hypothetical protein
MPTVPFDTVRYFGLPATLPMGNGTGLTASQANVLLHELSHLSADTEDYNLSYIPAPAVPGNPTNAKQGYDLTKPTSDAWFFQKFQENSAKNVTNQWVTPFFFFKS